MQELILLLLLLKSGSAWKKKLLILIFGKAPIFFLKKIQPMVNCYSMNWSKRTF